MRLPKIGMRIIKTMIAVFISILIYVLLMLLNKALGLKETDVNAPTTLYTPFFAAIAAAYALHKDKKSSLNQAKIRSVGSILGGYYGMIIVLVSEYFLMSVFNLHINNPILFKTITFFIVSIFIIPLIWFTVLIKQQTCVFITLLTYFSVTISIRNNLESVAHFATNRVISTLVGIGISLLVNNISLFRIRNKNVLFISSIDDNIIMKNQNSLSPYVKYKLNNLYYHNMPLTFVTVNTMSKVNYLFKDIDVGFPLIVMNGAAIYHMDSEKYEAVFNMNRNVTLHIDEILKEKKLNAFKYSIEDNMLNCFYEKLNNIAEIDFYEECKREKFDNFVRVDVTLNRDYSLYTIIDTLENIESLMEKLNDGEFINDIDCVVYPYNKVEGYYYLKINSKKANKENLVEIIKQRGNFEYMVICASGVTDLQIVKMADFSCCLNHITGKVKESVDAIIGDNPEKIFKVFDKIYYSRNINRTIKRLNKKYKK